MMFKINGLYTALITPFNEDGTINEQGLRDNIQYQLVSKVDGIVVLGSTGEAPTLNDEEKKRVIQIAKEEIKGQIPLVVGTGTYSTSTSIEYTKQAQQLGADAVLMIAPYYNRPTQEGFYLHFKEIADYTSLPIILYNHPGRCGASMTIQTIKRLARIPNIIGVKEITNSIDHLNNTILTFEEEFPNFSLLAGDDGVTYSFMANGAHGVISVASNLVPVAMKELVDACACQEFSRARKLHFKLLPLFNALNIESNPIPIKAAMNLLGFASGSCRLPLCDLMTENKEKLKTTIEGLNISLLNLAGIYG